MVSILLTVFFSVKHVDIMAMWGDFFGGTLNPLFTFLTFLGLIYTIILQRNELALSRRELELTRREVAKSSTALDAQNESMKQQRFESTLFNMIGVLNQIIDQMDLEESTGSSKSPRIRTNKGRDCFVIFTNNIRKYYNGMRDGKYVIWSGFDERIINDTHDEKRISDAYMFFYSKHTSELAHYFRVLYNIFKFIHESDYSNPIYAKILRAQLSDQELVILYYNCLSEYDVKFKELAIEFQLFDNLNIEKLIREEHVDLMPIEAFGNNFHFQTES